MTMWINLKSVTILKDVTTGSSQMPQEIVCGKSSPKNTSIDSLIDKANSYCFSRKILNSFFKPSRRIAQNLLI